MPTTIHISPERLKLLANGRLNGVEIKPVLHHLAVCDFCLGVIDVFWNAPPESAEASLPTHVANRIKTKVLSQIQQSLV